MPSPSDDGAMNALSEIAQWVRFADTKAGLLAAGLGVMLAGIAAQAATVVSAVSQGGALGALVAALFVWWAIFALALIGFLMHAIGPRTVKTGSALNRFAWPTIAASTTDELKEHVKRVPRDDDAWQQAVALSAIASAKYKACGRAVVAFMLVVVMTAAMIAFSHIAVH